jgi:hypothetical protein
MAALFSRKPKPSLQFVDPTQAQTQQAFAVNDTSQTPPPEQTVSDATAVESVAVNNPVAAQEQPYNPIASQPPAIFPGSPSSNDYQQPASAPSQPVDPYVPAQVNTSPFPETVPAEGGKGGDPDAPGQVPVGTAEAYAPPAGSNPGDANLAELKPLEGHPGQFTDGRGKGGGNEVNGSMQYAVFDSAGKFLGYNETVNINGAANNYGYSEGNQIPDKVEIPAPASGSLGDKPAGPVKIPVIDASTRQAGGDPTAPGQTHPDAVDRWMVNHAAAPAQPKVETNFAMATPPTAEEIVIDHNGAIASAPSVVPAPVINTNVPTLPPQDQFTSPPPSIASVDPSSVAGQLSAPGHSAAIGHASME